MTTQGLPVQPIAGRPVHFFWIVDTSSSMGVEGKLAQVDHAIRESLPEMRAVAAEHPGAELLVRVLTFSNGARWISSDPIPVNEFTWSGLEPDGLADLGEALKLLASQLEIPPMPRRAFPPVLALVTDGLPTDDWKAGLAELDRSTWGKKAVRVAISIGDDERTPVLEEFTGNPELVFPIENIGQLAKAILTEREL